MGTINYGRSDYITLGLPHPDEMDEEDVKSLFNEFEDVLSDADFHTYYHTELKYGYYSGFWINIENNYGWCYESYQDRKLANLDLTELKKALLKCADLGLVVCHSGWCTGYESYESTVKSIKEAIKGMREEIKTIPTWSQYVREGQ